MARALAQETKLKYEREMKGKGAASKDKKNKEAMARRQERKEKKGDANDDLFGGGGGASQDKDREEEGKVGGGYSIHIPTDSNSMPWYRQRAPKATYRTLSQAAKAGLWTYPRTAEQQARCAVFEALRAKDYYMSKGLRFGGDLVVYPGE